MSVKVAVRSRPLSANEQKENSPIVVNMNGNKVDVMNADGGTGRTFLYDQALWSTGVRIDGSSNEEATQSIVYDAIGAEMLRHALTGYNGCIFAYGQTGSGKTYTMMGTENDPGIIPRLVENLFTEVDRLKQAETEVCIEVSYYEVYCEKVRCLLRPTAGGFDDSALRVREHPKYGPFIEGLAKFVVTSQSEFLQLMNDGNKVRTTASTAMNATSSRSHAVFAITLTQNRKRGKFVTTTTSRLNLVDLAGSERVSKTLATGQRLTEGANINQSLTCLGNVISALAEVEEKGKARHIPYRDSVLTWILKDNLGGNSKTVMVAAISPSAAQFEETMSTLRYAERAKKIVNKAVVNESNNNEVIAALQKEIAALKAQLTNASSAERARLQEELAASEAVQKDLSTSLEEKLAETKRMMEERERYMKELEGKLKAQTSEIESLKRVNDEKEQQIAELLRRIAALAKEAEDNGQSGGEGSPARGGAGGRASPQGSPTGRGRAIEKMREEVAALEQEQITAETQIRGKRRHASDAAEGDVDLSILMEADAPHDSEDFAAAPSRAKAGRALASQVTPTAGEGGGPLQKMSSVMLDAIGENAVPAALKKGLRQSTTTHPVSAGIDPDAPDAQPPERQKADGFFDADLDSLDDFDGAKFGPEEDGSGVAAVGEGVSQQGRQDLPVDEDLEIDSDLADEVDSDEALAIDDDIVLDEDEAKPQPQAAARSVPPSSVRLGDAVVPQSVPSRSSPQPPPPPTAAPPQQQDQPQRYVDPTSGLDTASATRLEASAFGTEPPAMRHQLLEGSQVAWSREASVAQQQVRVENLQPDSAAARERQQQQRAMESAAALQTWAKNEARPEIFAPAQNIVELVVPSHALPNNRYLHEPFKVVKMNEAALIGQRKDRLWDIDFFAHTFGNYDVNGSKSFSLPSSHLFRVERDPVNVRRLTLFFFEAAHPYELEFLSASRRRRFYELAMLQRRNAILWCPSLCLDHENDVAITVRGTTIERPGRVMRVEGEAKFTVARMPYEVADFWYGCFSLEGGDLPRSTAVLGSFMPKESHDVYIIGIADVPSSLLGSEDIGQYFVRYLGAADYHVVDTTTTDSSKSRHANNAMIVICRRSFVVRISHVQVMEASVGHKKGVSRSDYTGAACALNINEASICVVLVNAKRSKCDARTRNACIRTLINSFPFGNTSLDLSSRFDYLIISGRFGFSATPTGSSHRGTALTPPSFTSADPLVEQMRLNNFMSNLQEGEPSATLKAVPDPMRVFFAVRPRVSRMDVRLYTTSRAFPMANSYITADLFSQRTYLSVFGQAVPRTQIIFENIQVMGERLPDVSHAHIQISGNFFENAPLTAPMLKRGPRHYTAAATATPILYPTVNHTEFLRLQTVHFVLLGNTGPSGSSSKATTLASGSLPIKNLLTLGETKEFAVPLYYHTCLVGVLQGSLLQTFYEKNYAEVAAAGLGRERFVSLVNCFENQVRQGTVWRPASVQPPLCEFSAKNPAVEQRRENFELPDPRGWRWLTDWQHDSRPDDAEGWIYSEGGHGALEFKETKHSTIRRRRWMRAMQAQDAITLHNYLSFKYEQMKETGEE